MGMTPELTMLAVIATEGGRSEIYGYKKVKTLSVSTGSASDQSGQAAESDQSGRAAEDEKRGAGRG